VVALDVEDRFFPPIDRPSVKLLFRFFDTLDVSNSVPLELGLFEAVGQFGITGQLKVELTLADALTLDCGMSVFAFDQVAQDTLEERKRELARLGWQLNSLRHVPLSMALPTLNKMRLSLGLTPFNELGARPDGADELKTRLKESGGEDWGCIRSG
jgi:hypothetical protein